MAIASPKTRRRLSVALVAFGLVPLALASLFAARRAESGVTRAVLDNLRSVADIERRRIEEVLTRNHERLGLVASRTTLRRLLSGPDAHDADTGDAMSRILEDARRSIPDFRRISVAAVDGVIAASTEDAVRGRALTALAPPEGLFGDGATDAVGLDPHGRLTVYLSAPLAWEGRVVGRLLIEANARSLADIVGDSAGLGRTGETLLGVRRDDAIVLLTPVRFDPDAALRPIMDTDAQMPLAVAVQGTDRSFADVRDYRGERVLAATAHIPQRGWGLVVKMERDEALAAVDDMRRWLLGGVVLVGVLVVGGAILFGRRADELLAAKAELEHRVAERTEELEAFCYSVSHDLREPVRTIGGFTDVVLEDHGADLDAAVVEHLRTIRGGADHLNELIDGLLVISRLGRQDLHVARVDMAAVVERAWHDVGADGVELRAEALDDATGDPAMVAQVWTNLLSNAVKFTRGRPQARITVTSEVSGGEVVYAVADNGIGFDSVHAEKIFGVFERAHARGEVPGTGVGLAIVSRIVRRHGGRVWAEGRPDEGATIWFTLPPSA